LTRRHKTVALVVRAFLALTVLFSISAFLARNHFHHDDNDLLDRALRIAILICGIGSVALRRQRLSRQRLQTVAALKGASGLLTTLISTTLQVTGLGAILAIFGFITTVLTGNEFYAYGAGLVGFVVLLYGYPTKSSWQQAVQTFGRQPAE